MSTLPGRQPARGRRLAAPRSLSLEHVEPGSPALVVRDTRRDREYIHPPFKHFP